MSMASFLLPAPTVPFVEDRRSPVGGWTPVASLDGFRGSLQGLRNSHQLSQSRSRGLRIDRANISAAAQSAKAAPSLPRETYKIFDEVDITVKCGTPPLTHPPTYRHTHAICFRRAADLLHPMFKCKHISQLISKRIS